MSAYTREPRWFREAGLGYVLTDDLKWSIGREGSGFVVIVPEGFWFDVSVPRGLRWIVSPHDVRHLKAAALHDYLLTEGWSAFSASAEMYEALKADQVPRWRRLVMWLAVSLFRWS